MKQVRLILLSFFAVSLIFGMATSAISGEWLPETPISAMGYVRDINSVWHTADDINKIIYITPGTQLTFVIALPTTPSEIPLDIDGFEDPELYADQLNGNWDFGDNQSSNYDIAPVPVYYTPRPQPASITHTYNTVGTYEVYWTVYDYGSPLKILNPLEYFWYNVGADDENNAVGAIKICVSDGSCPGGTTTINDGATYTYLRTVTLKLNGEPNDGHQIIYYRLSDDGVFDSTEEITWSTYTGSNQTVDWTLTPEAGTKKVYVQYKDSAGHTSCIPIYATIQLQVPINAEITSPTWCSYTSIKLNCLFPGATIYYTTDGSVPNMDNNPSKTREYDPDGVVVLHSLSQRIRAIAVKDNVLLTTTLFDKWYNYRECITDPCVSTTINIGSNDIYKLRISKIMPEFDAQLNRKTRVQLNWSHLISNDDSQVQYNIDRTINGVTTDLGNVYGIFFEDVIDWDGSSTFAVDYTVHRVSGSCTRPIGDCLYTYTWNSSQSRTIRATLASVSAVENQTVDSRFDTRTCLDQNLNFKFEKLAYRGGLFVGYVDEPDHSRISRSLLKFDLTNAPVPPSNQNLMAGSVCCYYLDSFAENVPTTVGCQYIGDSWHEETKDTPPTECVTWSTAPGVDSGTATTTTTVIKNPSGSIPTNWKTPNNWCSWDILGGLTGDLVGFTGYTADKTLSACLASSIEKNPDQNNNVNSWAYFSKKEYDADYSPVLMYAYGGLLQGTTVVPEIMIAEVKLHKSEVQGGNTVKGTVTLNAPAPSGGFQVWLLTTNYAKSYVSGDTFDSNALTIQQGKISADFTVSTAIVADTEIEIRACEITPYMPYSAKSATLKILP